MARTTIGVVTLSTTTGTVHPGGSLYVANGAQFAPTRPSQLMVRVTNTIATAGSVTIKAGDNPPAFRNGLGDLTLAIASAGKVAFCIETARFMQDDGYIYLDWTGAIDGTVEVYEMAADAF